jgi:asparagine synthase (glutamine-hydrolysing)
MARKVLAEEGKTGLHTFSSIPEHVAESDESAIVDAVLAQGGVEAHKLSDERMSPLAYLEDILWHADQPPVLPPHFNWGMREATHREGVRVALTGIDGDTVVDQSVGRLLELARGGRWITLAREVDAIARVSNRPRQLVLRRHVVKPFFSERMLRVWQSLRGIRQPIGLAPTVIRPEFAQEVGLPERLATQRPSPPEKVRMSQENHWGNLLSGVWPYAFETNNKICAAFSVDDTHPFFDRRLVEFCLGVPSEQKLTQGYARMIMRRGMAGILPEKVRWRTSKGNYSYTFSYGLLKHDRKILEQTIMRDSHLIGRYVDTGELRRIYERFLVESSAIDAQFLVSAVYLITWLRQEADLMR